METEGILLCNKEAGITSFAVVHRLRKKLGIQKIGHLGTLDPFATGLLVLMIGKKYTRQADFFLQDHKEYTATLCLGSTTTTYDPEGVFSFVSDIVPSFEEVEATIALFQGIQQQLPPIFCAKKIGGARMYMLARANKPIERVPITVTFRTTLLAYEYPFIKFHVVCSKGTYIRSIAHDIGEKLGTGAYLTQLHRIRSGKFLVENAIDTSSIKDVDTAILTNRLIKI